jgi:hypothetical protein
VVSNTNSTQHNSDPEPSKSQLLSRIWDSEFSKLIFPLQPGLERGEKRSGATAFERCTRS